ncbi:hypothetical protein ACRARG_12635 [Pseudooceanicola sp. C21-150M6]|uniref:hypothetical protein n=1 Tax=Pseudooceanicola sp. C21-150M6 TaxID=3434355 RepID=UPI003D7FD062
MIHSDPETIYVNRLGSARIGSICDADLRLAEETARLAAIRDAAMIPDECGPRIIAAPARGAYRTFVPRRSEMTAAGPRSRHDGYMGLRALRQADAFDVMTEQAQRRHAAEAKRREKRGEKAVAFVPPYSIGQVEIGREYAALVERCAGSGVKCASLETLRAQSAGGGDREAAIFRDFQRLRYFERRIGDGLAKAVRRIRPGKTRTKAEAEAKAQLIERQRRAIRDQVLVDSVCVGGMTLTQVLEAHGWGDNKNVRAALRAALCAALDRMRGFDLARPQNVD